MTHPFRFLLFCMLGSAAQVQAGVYIAPLDDDGSIEYSEEQMYIEVDSKRVQSYLPRSSQETGDPNIPMVGSDRLNIEGSRGVAGDISRGAGVPLRQAIHAVLPGDDWTVNFDGSVSPAEQVVWSSNGDWKDILQDISKRNGVTIAVNEDDKVVGVSDEASYARLLSSPGADVEGIQSSRQAGIPAAQNNSMAMSEGDRIWNIDSNLSIRDNLIAWSERTDWYIDWDYPTDYKLQASAQFVGTFKEAARDLMYALSDAGYPIGAEVNSKNRVLRIRGIK